MPPAAISLIACLVTATPIYILTNRKRIAPPVRGPREKDVWRAMPENCAGDFLPTDVPTLQVYASSMQTLYHPYRQRDACTICQLHGCEVNRFYHWNVHVNTRLDLPKMIFFSILLRHPHLSVTYDDFKFTTAHAFCVDCLWKVKVRRGSVFLFELLASLIVVAAGIAALFPATMLVVGKPGSSRLEALLWLSTSLMIGWLGLQGRWWADQWRYPPVIRIIGRPPLRLKSVQNRR